MQFKLSTGTKQIVATISRLPLRQTFSVQDVCDRVKMEFADYVAAPSTVSTMLKIVARSGAFIRERRSSLYIYTPVEVISVNKIYSLYTAYNSLKSRKAKELKKGNGGQVPYLTPPPPLPGPPAKREETMSLSRIVEEMETMHNRLGELYVHLDDFRKRIGQWT